MVGQPSKAGCNFNSALMFAQDEKKRPNPHEGTLSVTQRAKGNNFIFVECRLPLCTILECTLITGWKDSPQSPSKALAPAQNDAHIARRESAKERRGAAAAEKGRKWWFLLSLM